MSALPSSAALLAALLEGQNIMRRELEIVRGEVAQLREALARRPEENKDSEALLSAISYEVGDTEFFCSSLIEHAQLDAAAELRAALGRFFVQGVNPRRLGKWLAKMHKRGTVGRYVVEHQQDDGHRGGTWSVRVSRI